MALSSYQQLVIILMLLKAGINVLRVSNSDHHHVQSCTNSFGGYDKESFNTQKVIAYSRLVDELASYVASLNSEACVTSDALTSLCETLIRGAINSFGRYPHIIRDLIRLIDLIARHDFSPEDQIFITKWLDRWAIFVSEEKTASTIVSLSPDVVARGKTIDLSQKKTKHKNQKGTEKANLQQDVLTNTSDELHDPNNRTCTNVECEYNRDSDQRDMFIATNDFVHNVRTGNSVSTSTLINTDGVLQSANNLGDELTTNLINTDDATQYVNNLDCEHMTNLYDTEGVVQSVNDIGDEQTNLIGTCDVMQSDDSGDDEQTPNIMRFPENDTHDSDG